MFYVFVILMLLRPPGSTLDRSSAASDVYKRQALNEKGLRQSTMVKQSEHSGPQDALNEKGLRRRCHSLCLHRWSARCPERKGITTRYSQRSPRKCKSARCPERKGITTAGEAHVCCPGHASARCPERKGITTVLLEWYTNNRESANCPEEKGITTGNCTIRYEKSEHAKSPQNKGIKNI